MSLLTIVNCMDSVLRKKCQKIDDINENLVTLADNMIETMYAASGSGLAAQSSSSSVGSKPSVSKGALGAEPAS